MKRGTRIRRRPSVTDVRAARLHRLVSTLVAEPRSRDQLLSALNVGLRTFYRELELLRRCGIKVRLVRKAYTLATTLAEAESLLPFPDPQLSFADIAELARGEGAAARRLAERLQRVLDEAGPRARPSRKGRS